MIRVVIFSFLAFASSCYNVNTKKKSIVGKWTEYKVETKDGSDTTTAGIKLLPFEEWEFTDQHYINFRKEKVDYKLINDTLFIRNEPWYLVEKLSNDTLIVAEIYRTGYNPNGLRNYFKKVK